MRLGVMLPSSTTRKLNNGTVRIVTTAKTIFSVLRFFKINIARMLDYHHYPIKITKNIFIICITPILIGCKVVLYETRQ